MLVMAVAGPVCIGYFLIFVCLRQSLAMQLWLGSKTRLASRVPGIWHHASLLKVLSTSEIHQMVFHCNFSLPSNVSRDSKYFCNKGHRNVLKTEPSPCSFLQSTSQAWMKGTFLPTHSCEIINCYSFKTGRHSCDSLRGAGLLMLTSRGSLLVWAAGSEMTQLSRYY